MNIGNLSRFRNHALAVAAIAAIVPAAANASPAGTSLDACAKAFASALAADGAPLPKFKIAHRGGQYFGSIDEFYSHEFSFDMQARDPKTGSVLARATCTADRKGLVTSFTRVSPAEAASTLAAR